MSKVWVIYEWSYEGDTPTGIFSTKAKAEKALDKLIIKDKGYEKEDFYIDEHNLNELFQDV